MPRYKTKIILNPNANMGAAWRVAADLRPTVAEFGGADWAGTVYPGHAKELTRQAAAEGYELIIAAGGDGTAHEVINGLMEVPPAERPRLGIVPLGSGNDYVHALGLPAEAAAALRQIFMGTPQKMDIGKLEDDRGRTEYMNNTLGIGFDAVVTIRSHTLPVVRGFLMYLTAVVQTIFLNHNPIHMHIHTDDDRWDDEYLMLVLCNGPREGGGFIIAPDAKPNDGLIDYAGVRKVSRAMMFRLLPEFLKGTHTRFKQVQMGQLRTMELTANRPLFIHIDGEVFAGFGNNVRKLKFELLPNAIEVLV